jgi:hypothetical protein
MERRDANQRYRIVRGQVHEHGNAPHPEAIRRAIS